MTVKFCTYRLTRFQVTTITPLERFTRVIYFSFLLLFLLWKVQSWAHDLTKAIEKNAFSMMLNKSQNLTVQIHHVNNLSIQL